MIPAPTTWGALPPFAHVLGPDGGDWVCTYDQPTRTVTTAPADDLSRMVMFAAQPDAVVYQLVPTTEEAVHILLTVWPGSQLLEWETPE